jgi:hypothetical protein
MEWKVGKQSFSANYFPQLYKDVEFEKPELDWKVGSPVKTAEGWKTVVKITSANYARFVYVDIPLKQVRDVTLSDNYFDLIPGETKVIGIQSNRPLKIVNVKSLLTT